ncbi:amino acid ABC transporter substrate-binding protein [Pedobacter yulinensis]|uniref:Amino acid ABC transporter substrate-binding protein n=1 Tax=Pedobacter yulinensis TaxID=2126353 RepID=A0A2T3HII7_9SPHI|nr:ABC transporter substrate-binding protein [Pedobacter yulinensis]PST82247.1 amino acid ABC transporter substrate-binding protein [Pedobacter yulinensis]
MSGNRFSFLLLLLVLAGCSPKIRKTTDTPVREQEKAIEKKEVRRFSEARISLLLPFDISRAKLAAVTKQDLEKSSLAIDFYQGFKLGLDSAAQSGLNFQLHVFDTRDENSQIATLYKNEDFQTSHLLVGPIFPQGQKFIASYAHEHQIPVVSPLAASNPREFNNPNLVSVVNNIELHAGKIVDYISDHYDPAKTIVVLINPKTTDDEIFAAPLRSQLRQNKRKFVVQEFASVYALERRLVKGKNYAVLITSDDRKFVTPSIDKLYKLKFLKTGGYPINLFGHPNWMKQSYSTDKLQKLNTSITSSYKVDYKSAVTKSFIRKYRSTFGFEPGEYAFKGFDNGLYFGRLLSKYGPAYARHLPDEPYKGLHNNFRFVYDRELGYINTELMLLRYSNYALQVID